MTSSHLWSTSLLYHHSSPVNKYETRNRHQNNTTPHRQKRKVVRIHTRMRHHDTVKPRQLPPPPANRSITTGHAWIPSSHKSKRSVKKGVPTQKRRTRARKENTIATSWSKGCHNTGLGRLYMRWNLPGKKWRETGAIERKQENSDRINLEEGFMRNADDQEVVVVVVVACCIAH